MAPISIQRPDRIIETKVRQGIWINSWKIEKKSDYTITPSRYEERLTVFGKTVTFIKESATVQRFKHQKRKYAMGYTVDYLSAGKDFVERLKVHEIKAKLAWYELEDQTTYIVWVKNREDVITIKMMNLNDMQDEEK